MPNTIFESTNMAAVKYAERIFDAVAESDIENGTVGYLDGINDDYEGHVVYNFVAGVTDDLKAGDVVIANNPAWSEDVSRLDNQRRDKYIIPAGTPFRAFVVRKNDEFAISIDGFTSATQATVEAATEFIESPLYVTADETTGKFVASSEAPESGALMGQIMRKRISGAQIQTTLRNMGHAVALYVIKVIGVGVAE